CYHKVSELQTGYYPNDTTKTWDTCYTSCATCNELGDSTDHKCLTCLTNFVAKSDMTTSCFDKNVPITGYIFKADTNLFTKCYSTCGECFDAPSDTSDRQCNGCASGSYPRYNDSKMCHESG